MMYIKRLSVLNGMLNCRSFTQLCQKSQAKKRFPEMTFRAGVTSTSSFVERHISSCNKRSVVDCTVKCESNGTSPQNWLHFRSCCDDLRLNPPANKSVLLTPVRNYSYYEHHALLKHNASSSIKMKDAFRYQCNCFYCVSSNADGGDTNPDFKTLAKEIIEQGKKINVMAGSVPLIKVVTLLKELHGQHFHLDELMRVLSQQLQLLFESENVIPLTELLLSHGLKHSVVIHILENLPLAHGNISLQNLHKFIDDSLKNFRLIGFTEKDLHHFLTRNPEILFTESKTRNSVLAKLKGLFTKEDALFVIRIAPNVLCDPWKETNLKFDYAYFTMGYKQKAILKSHLFEHDLQHIQDRHIFLVRAGFFLPVKEKDDPKLNPNPPLDEVIDVPDRVFAKMFGGLSLEEYKVYLEMREIEREEDSNLSDDSDEDDDDEEEEEEQYLHKKAKKSKLKRK